MSKKNRSGLARDWGVYLKRNIQYKKAEVYLNRSLEVDPVQFKTLLESSKCKLKQSQANDALMDVKKCLTLEPNNIKAQHQHAKCLGGLNQIENAIATAYGITFEYPTAADVHHTKDSLEMSLRSAFGRSTVPILRKYKLHLKRDGSQTKTKELTIKKCGPIEAHREKAIELMKHKLYFDSTFAEQIEFWTQLQQDETLDDNLRKLIDEITRNFNTHESMLYAREPFYAKRDRFDKGSLSKVRHRTFFYAQEETRREALWQLRNIKALAVHSFADALRLTERVLSEFYAIKMRTVFPAKFEFLCHVCHFIGTEYLQIYRAIPADLMSLKVEDRLIALFNVWGKMLQGEDLCDKKVEYFTKRLQNAIYDMEKTYLFHQLSEEESQRFARDAVKHAMACKSNIWTFLAYFNIIRVDAMKQNYHPMKDDLDKLQEVAKQLDAFTQVFVNTAIRSFEDIKSAKN
ncbi:uncharacterized protein LOC129575376 isoform X2 [Sitodiplosis mosellana]|uniref:uncharacterized protein LOC129575376 isoform X2 n=1 Tax=Sitodiplosis mosellana TaxID=263140 RepID=UPI002443B724|nr:uncharacterized protein LOC129575376 isoform X2 [Sitodiplosis mosellana]